MRCGIALGSNLGDRLANLSGAKERVLEAPGVVGLCRVSSVYASDPVDCAPDSPRYFNAVLELEFEGMAIDLLDALQAIEVSMGRPSSHGFNTPRTIDIDILYFGDEVINETRLTVPHPRLQQRRFVLEPLSKIVPNLILPTTETSVKCLLQELQDEEQELIEVSELW